MKASASSRRVPAIAIALCSLAIIGAFVWFLLAQPPSQAGQTGSDVSEPVAEPNAPATSFTAPLEDSQNNPDTQVSTNNHPQGTVTVTATSKKYPASFDTPDTSLTPAPAPANTAPVLTIVLPVEGTYQANAQDGAINYRALTFSATATDNEDGAITDAASFHWSNQTSNCSIAGVDHCEDETHGNNFTMNMPVSGVCPGIKSMDLSRDYKFIVTVRDSSGLTDVREIDISITYHCIANPISVPQITINSPTAIHYHSSLSDGWGQPYSSILFQASATDNEDGTITNPAMFTWRLLSSECGEVVGGINIVCQAERVGNNFTMDLLGACVGGSGDTGVPVVYTYELSVQDSDGNIATKQISFSVFRSCGDQGN